MTQYPTNWTTRTLALLGLLAALLLAAPAFAQEGEPARSPGEVSRLTNEISYEIESPYCPGKTLEMCPSGGAAEVRQEIQELARQGLSKDEIKDAVIDKYGEEYRLIEPESRDNYTLFGVLGAAFVMCLLAIWFFSARRGEEAEPAEDLGDVEDDDLSAEEREYLDELRDEYLD